MEATAKVSSIFIYPVKSCRGISLSQAPLTPTGFRWDRNWLVVNYRGRAYTQRVEPKLALVEIELPDEAFSEGWEPTKNSFMSKISVKFNVSSHKSSVSAIQLDPPKKNLYLFCSLRSY